MVNAPPGARSIGDSLVESGDASGKLVGTTGAAGAAGAVGAVGTVGTCASGVPVSGRAQPPEIRAMMSSETAQDVSYGFRI
jgi:hypothetical protein